MARTVFLGTSEFAVAVLERLATSPHAPALVVTRPDRPRGRGRKLAAPPVATAARELGLELSQPASVNVPEARARIAAAEPEAVCVCAYGALIKDPLLSEHRMLNVHPSLLPRWRGAAPIERAIIAGDERTGVSIMEVTAGLDSGPVCAQLEEEIRPRDDYGTLSRRLMVRGGDLLVETLDGSPPCTEQDEDLATYAEKISGEDRRLDPARPAVELERVVRGLAPHVGAWVELDGGARLGVLGASVRGEGSGESRGTIAVRDRTPALVCAEGELVLELVKPPGGRQMRGEEWLRGHRR